MNIEGGLCVNYHLLYYILDSQHSYTTNFYTVLISNKQAFILQILRVIDILGEKLEFFSCFRFDMPSFLLDTNGGRGEETIGQCFEKKVIVSIVLSFAF